ESQQFAVALPILRQLTALRRNAGDWMLLGDCFLGSDNLPEATAAYEKAVEIDPNLIDIHELLAVCYERAGDPDQAQQRRRLAKAIEAALAQQARE
ncbi:MAG: tetratricopeptide repeat protein, partial [Planctomycetota bacterium]